MSSVLIIEDSKDIGQVLRDALQEAGYGADVVYTGIDGLAALRATDYDLVMQDIMLPYMNGDEVLRELRKFSDVPVIVISAKGGTSMKVDLLKMGADDYIQSRLTCQK